MSHFIQVQNFALFHLKLAHSQWKQSCSEKCCEKNIISEKVHMARIQFCLLVNYLQKISLFTHLWGIPNSTHLFWSCILLSITLTLVMCYGISACRSLMRSSPMSSASSIFYLQSMISMLNHMTILFYLNLYKSKRFDII